MCFKVVFSYREARLCALGRLQMPIAVDHGRINDLEARLCTLDVHEWHIPVDHGGINDCEAQKCYGIGRLV